MCSDFLSGARDVCKGILVVGMVSGVFVTAAAAALVWVCVWLSR